MKLPNDRSMAPTGWARRGFTVAPFFMYVTNITKESSHMRKHIIATAGALLLVAGTLQAQQPARADSSSLGKPTTSMGQPVDINAATREQLVAAGWGPYSDAIIAGRPYSTMNDLVDKRIVPQTAYNQGYRQFQIGDMTNNPPGPGVPKNDGTPTTGVTPSTTQTVPPTPTTAPGTTPTTPGVTPATPGVTTTPGTNPTTPGAAPTTPSTSNPGTAAPSR